MNAWTGLEIAGNCARFSLAQLATFAALECERAYPIASETTEETTCETVAPVSGATVRAGK
jgi:hypothetical protein